jgi:TPR repeat protein
MYFNGEGVPQDYKEALKWHRKAADQGNANAQYNIAVAYAKGQGVPQDHAEAVKWVRKSAEQGNAGAQHVLGQAYANGDGVRPDHSEAYVWFSLAAANGDEPASALRNTEAKRLSPQALAHAQARAREISKAIQAKNPNN